MYKYIDAVFKTKKEQFDWDPRISAKTTEPSAYIMKIWTKSW